MLQKRGKMGVFFDRFAVSSPASIDFTRECSNHCLVVVVDTMHASIEVTAELEVSYFTISPSLDEKAAEGSLLHDVLLTIAQAFKAVAKHDAGLASPGCTSNGRSHYH